MGFEQCDVRRIPFDVEEGLLLRLKIDVLYTILKAIVSLWCLHGRTLFRAESVADQ